MWRNLLKTTPPLIHLCRPIAILLLLVDSLAIFTSAKRLPDFRWSSNNNMFLDSRRHRLNNVMRNEQFTTLAVNEHDVLDFVCPEPEDTDEQLVVHMVSELSFLACQLDSNAVEFLTCDEPTERSVVGGGTKRRKIVFRQFSPTPDVIVFTPGSSYYFISTSNGTRSGLRNSQGGYCVSKNMRLKIDFAYNSHSAVGATDIPLLSTDSSTSSYPLVGQMEYFVEEQPLSTTVSETAGNVKTSLQEASALTSFSADELSKNDVRLASVFQVNPEYVEFVRRHAVRGGTGAIEFPPDSGLLTPSVSSSGGENADADPNTIKRPRFVSAFSRQASSNIETKNSAPPIIIDSHSSSGGAESPFFNEIFRSNLVESEADVNGAENAYMSLKGSNTFDATNSGPHSWLCRSSAISALANFVLVHFIVAINFR